jgi:putative inorganic carbon (HCO3(-)) transporter
MLIHMSAVPLKTRCFFPGAGSVCSMILLFALTANFLFPSGHDLQRCVELVAVCGIAIVAIVRAGSGNFFKLPISASILLALFLVFGIASVASAYSIRHATYEWSIFVLLLVVIFTVAVELMKDGELLDRLLHWVGIACGLYSMRLLLNYAMALAGGFQPSWGDVAVGFSNYRFLSHTQTALLPLIVLLYLKAPRPSIWSKVWFALTAFWWSILFMCEARATVLALSVGCMGALFLRRSHAQQFIKAMALTAVVGLVLYALLFIMLPVLAGLHPVSLPWNVVVRTASDPTSARNSLWELALQMIRMHPWLGAGPLHFAHESAGLHDVSHPHNWILQIAAEWGIPAFLCLASTIILGARALVRSGARFASGDVDNQRMLVTLQVVCTAIFVDGFFSGVLVMPQSQLAIALVLGIACAWVCQQNRGTPATVSGLSVPTRLIVIGTVAAGLCGVIWSVEPDFVRHARGDALTPAEFAVNPDIHGSRMWEAGHF